MWSSRKYAAVVMAGGGLAVAAAAPASACVDWGYTGVFSYGRPYANVGIADYPVYKHLSCGGSYQIQGWGECNGYGLCGWAPFPPVIVRVPDTDPAVTAPPDPPLITRAAPRRPRRSL